MENLHLTKHSRAPFSGFALPRAFFAALTFIALSFLAASDAQAGQRIWNGAGTDGLWTNSTNWSGAVPNGNDDFLLAGTTRLTNTNNFAVDGVANVNTFIVFSNTAGAFVLNGTNNTANAMILTAAGALTNLSTSTQTFNFGMTFRAAAGTNSVDTANGSIILNGIIAGTNINKLGAATLFLNGTNTFSGVLSNSAGAIRVGNDSGLGTTNSNTVIVSGAALELITNNAGGNISIGAEALSLAGTGINSAGALRNITGSNSYGGLVTITNATRINSDAGTLTLTNTGTITGATFGLTFGGAGNLIVNSIIGTTTGTVNKDGAGTLILGAANTYTGDTTVGAGVLQLSGNGRIADASAVVVSNGATFDLNSVSDTVDGVSGAGAVTLGGATLTVSNSATNNLSGVLSGTGGLTKVGAGTQILSGSNNSYGGTTTIGAGALAVSNLANAGVNSSIGTNGTIVITNGGVLEYRGSTVSIDRSINLAGAAGVIGVTNSATSLTIAGAITNTGSLVKTNAGKLILTASNSYGGTTLITNGVLNIQNDAGLGGTGSGTTVGSGAALELQGGITIGAETMALSGTGISAGGALRNISGNNTYGGTITNVAASRINSDAGTLTLSGAINANALALTFGGAGNIAANGAITNSTSTVTKDGAGTLTLSAANTYTGDTVAGAGVVRLSGSGSIADASAVVVSNGATFDFNSISDTVDGVSGAGTVTLGSATLTVSNSATNNFSGALSGTGGLTKVGAGTQILSGTTNSYGGTTTIGAGVLAVSTLANAGQNSSIGTNGTIIITNNGVLEYWGSTVSIDRNINLAGAAGVIGVTNTATSLTIAGAITNTGSLVKTNAGELILTASNSYGGTTTVGAGVLNIQNNAGLGATNSGTTVISGAVLELEGGVTIGAETLALNGTGISAGGALRNISGDNTYQGTITNVTASRINSDAGTLTLSGAINANALALTFGGAGSIAVSGAITNSASTLTKDGAGTVILSGSNNYTGATTVSVGALRAASSNALGTVAAGTTVANGAALELSGGITIGAEALALNGTGTNAGGALRNISGNNTYGGTITNVTASRINSDADLLTLSAAINANGLALTFGGAGNIAANAAITNSASTVTKDGAGTLTLAAANTYSGGTVINAGTVAISNAASFGSNTVTFASNNTTVAALAGVLFTNNIALTGNGTIDVGGFNLTNSGIISNTGTLTKAGAGTLILGRANTYSGGTVINAGTVAISNAASFGSNTVTFASNDTKVVALANMLVTNTYALTGNGTMDVGANLGMTNSGAISGAGGLTKSGVGTVVLSASNNFSGTTTLSAGVLSLANTNALSASTLDHSSAGSVSFSNLTGANLGGLQGATGITLTNLAGTAVALNVGGNNSSTTYSGALSGGGALNKVGTGTLALSGNSSFTGATIISNGAIRVSNNNGLGATNGGTTVLAGAALEVDGGIAIGAEALTLSNNGISSGGALRSISGANTYGGLITLGTGVAVGVDADSLTLNGGVAPGGGSSFTKVGAGTLILNSTSTATGIVTISGGTMQLGTNGAIAPVAMNVTNGSTFDLNGRNATLGASGNLNVYLTGATLKSGAGTISLNALGVTVHSAANANSSTISGNLNLGGVTNTFNVADGAAAEDLVVSAAVSNGGIIKTNTGVLVLSGANTYSGGTLVAQGTLSGDTTSLQGNVTNNAAVIFNQSTNGTYASVLSGGGTLLKTNSGTLILTNANTQSGGTTIGQGTLQVGNGSTTGSLAGVITNNGSLVYNRSDNLTQSTAISGSGNLIKLGAGTLSLSASNGYTGTTLISNGVVSISTNAALAGTTAINMNNGTGLTYTGGSATIDRNISVTNGTGTIRNTGGGTLALSGSLSKNGTTLTFTGGAFNITGVISGASANSDLVVDAATVTLNNTNTYNGPTFIRNAGILNAAVVGAMPTNTRSAVTMDDAGTGNSVFNVTASQQIASLTGAASSTNTIATNTSLTIGTTSGNTTFAGVISGGGSLVKDGASTQTLSGTNTYSGTTTINAGTLAVSGGSAIANNGAVSLSNNAGAVFAVNGSETIGSLQGGGASGGNVSIASGQTLTVAETGSQTFAGLITNSGALVKSGAGTTILTGTNTYSGGTLVSGGVLSGSTTSLQGNITNNASVVFDQSAGGTYAGVLSGSGSLTKTNAGTLTLTGANTQSGTTVGAGTLQIGNGGTTGSLAGAITNNGNLIFNRSDSLAQSGAITGTGSLTKNGAGTLVLSGANTYAGQTTLEGGRTTILGSINSSADFLVGSGSSGASLVISNGGTVANGGNSSIGNDRGPTGVNSVLVTGSNSLWTSVSLSFRGNFAGDSNSLIISDGGTVQSAGNLSFGDSGAGVNSLLVTGANSRLAIGGFLLMNSASVTGNSLVISNGGTVSVGLESRIGLVGSETVLVTGANSLWTNSGALVVGASGSGHSFTVANGGTVAASSITLAQDAGSSATLNIGALGGNGTAGTIITPTIAFGAGAGAINFNQSDATTVSAAISGAGSLNQLGAGTTTLSGSNTYTGGTLVSGGALSGDTASLIGEITNNARVVFNQPISGTYAGVLSGNGSLLKTNTGTLILTGGNTQSGGTFVGAGTLQIGNGGTTGSLAGAITNNASLIFNRSDSLTQSGAITGTGSLTKLGAGTTTLTGNNTYIGTTTVSAGTLELANASGSALGSTGSLNVANGATLLISQANQVNNTAAVSLSGGTIRTASGVSEAFGNLSVTGSGFLDFGTTSYANANTINFGTYTPSALLTINNFNFGSTLTFGSDLTSTINNSSFFTFNSGGIASSSWDGTTFTITAIPEPSTYLAAAGLLGLMLWPSRRRVLRDAKKILGLRAPMRDRLAARQA